MTTRHIVLAATLSLATSHAWSQDLKSKFLNNFANAVVAGSNCKSWKVNPEMAVPVMKFLKMTTEDISPGGADWPLFQQDIQQAQESVRPLDEDEICTATGKMFGPHGVVAPNLMIPTGK